MLNLISGYHLIGNHIQTFCYYGNFTCITLIVYLFIMDMLYLCFSGRLSSVWTIGPGLYILFYHIALIIKLRIVDLFLLGLYPIYFSQDSGVRGIALGPRYRVRVLVMNCLLLQLFGFTFIQIRGYYLINYVVIGIISGILDYLQITERLLIVYQDPGAHFT